MFLKLNEGVGGDGDVGEGVVAVAGDDVGTDADRTMSMA